MFGTLSDQRLTITADAPRGVDSAMSDQAPNITALLERATLSDRAAVNDLFTAVYDELRRLAATLMKQERTEHTLQPIALVYEAILRGAEDCGGVARPGRVAHDGRGGLGVCAGAAGQATRRRGRIMELS